MTARAASHPAAELFGGARIAAWLGAGLRLAHALRPTFGTRLAARLFFTPLPGKRAARRLAPPAGWSVERWPFEAASLTVYRRAGAGAGARVLLVHGWAGHAQQLLPLAERLAGAGFEPVLLDFPAHGRSDGSRSTLPQFLRALEYAAARLGPLNALVAHSLGALAAAAALQRGLALRRLVLLAPSPPPQQVLGWFARGLGLDPAQQERMRAHIEAREGLLLDRFEPERLGPALALPTLLVHDRADRVAPFDLSRRLAALGRGVRLLPTDGLGHRRLLDDAAVGAAVLDHLR